MTQVLKLNADYSPIAVVPWSDALYLVMDGKADEVASFDRIIRSARAEFQMPAVIRLRKYVSGLGKSGCSRENVLARDEYTCQYCGARPRTKTGKPLIEELTIDHVIPKALARSDKKVYIPRLKEWRPLSGWDNLVCACGSCNGRKANRPLEKSGLNLINGWPKAPDRIGRIKIMVGKYRIPDEWKDYLPLDSGWRDYWDAELED